MRQIGRAKTRESCIYRQRASVLRFDQLLPRISCVCRSWAHSTSQRSVKSLDLLAFAQHSPLAVCLIGLELMNGATGTQAVSMLLVARPNCPNRADSMSRDSELVIHQECMHFQVFFGTRAARSSLPPIAYANTGRYLKYGISALAQRQTYFYSLPIHDHLNCPRTMLPNGKIHFFSLYFPPKQDYGLGFVRPEPIPNWRTSCFSMGKLFIRFYFFSILNNNSSSSSAMPPAERSKIVLVASETETFRFADEILPH